MADYYPILARAVSRLATNNAQARQELYEHARTVLAAQLRRHDPQFSAPETISERIAFEAATLRLEAEMRSLGEKTHENVWPVPTKLLTPLSQLSVRVAKLQQFNSSATALRPPNDHNSL